MHFFALLSVRPFLLSFISSFRVPSSLASLGPFFLFASLLPSFQFLFHFFNNKQNAFSQNTYYLDLEWLFHYVAGTSTQQFLVERLNGGLQQMREWYDFLYGSTTDQVLYQA